jgi:protein arginine N-methyltransferase 1
VDGSEGAAEAARRIIRANGLQDKITVVHGTAP